MLFAEILPSMHSCKHDADVNVGRDSGVTAIFLPTIMYRAAKK